MSDSLSIYNGNDYQEFLSMSVSIKDNAGTGFELFPGELLEPKKKYITFPKELYALLVAYYNNAYNYNFTFLTNILEHPDAIATLPGITIYKRIKIGNEIFGPRLILFENIINLLEGSK
ncbi:43_t:CDS:2, partial [Gigaspora rosea]